jgi:hypothetical protein
MIEPIVLLFSRAKSQESQEPGDFKQDQDQEPRAKSQKGNKIKSYQRAQRAKSRASQEPIESRAKSQEPRAICQEPREVISKKSQEPRAYYQDISRAKSQELS